jgi:DNA-binding transcriptional ArsR family regulator
MSEQTTNKTIGDVSAAFDLLRDARRRGVLYMLKQNGRTTIDELAHRIAAWQSTDGEESADPVAVKTSLVHAHLPKLADAGAVEYDREETVVELADVGELDPLLRCTREREPGFFAPPKPSTSNV